MASQGSSSVLGPEYQEWGAHVTGDIVEQPEGIIQDKKNRGRRQRGERPSVKFGGEGWTLLVGAFCSHSFRPPSMGLARVCQFT